MRIKLTKDFSFEAAHVLPHVGPEHKCGRMHGHSFKVEVSVEGEVDPHTGWFCDHGDISRAVKPLIEQLDHACLNDIEGLENPTFENVAGWLWKRIQPICPGLREIVIHETANARCSYRGE